MNKTIRLLFFFFISVLLITMLLSWLMPLSQSVDKTISINAPATDVYAQIAPLEQFNQWSVWNLDDSTVKHTITGTDAEAGAKSTWKGDPDISGEGQIEIRTAEPGKKVEQAIHFWSPRKNEARSAFTLQEQNGITTVSWHFEVETPRPWNIFNMFSGLDKQMGAAFDSSLALLKKRTEKTSAVTHPGYAILEMEWPDMPFAMIRQEIRQTDVPAFVQRHFPLLYEEASRQKTEPGNASVLYFNTPGQTASADIATALPLPPGKELGSAVIRTEKLNASRAIYTDYFGDPKQTALALDALRRYMATKEWKEKAPVIEQYLNNREREPDTLKWKTRVILLKAD